MAFQVSSRADISTLLLKAIKCAYEKGVLSISQISGILSLIPKENRIHCFTKNWRPITLLNTDYRIFAKAIANRIKKVLLYLINSDQTGFLNPIPPGLFESGAACGGEGGTGKCPRPISLIKAINDNEMKLGGVVKDH